MLFQQRHISVSFFVLALSTIAVYITIMFSGNFVDKITGKLHRSRPSQPVLSADRNYKSCLYFANWAIYAKKHTPQDIDYSQVTHIFYSFIDIVPETGALKLSDEWADIQIPVQGPNGKNAKGNLQLFYQLKQIHRHVKVAMSIGGWSYRDHFAKGLSDDAKLATFVDSAIDFLLEYGFDGIDLDWEYPNNAFEAKQYSKLVVELRKRLDAVENRKQLKRGQLTLTAAIPAMPSSLTYFRLKEMDTCISFWNLMTYDFAGSWSSRTQYHSNLYSYPGGEWSAAQSVDLLKAQYNIAPHKIVLGMPLYARQFLNSGGLNQPYSGVGGDEGIVDYKNIVGVYSDQYDETAVTGFSYNSSTKTFLGYENPKSSRVKGDYVVSKGLGGGMWWESSGEVFNDLKKGIINNFLSRLGGPGALDKSDNNLDYSESKYLYS